MEILKNNHLCYSLNVFPGITIDDKLLVLKEKLPVIREQVRGSDKGSFAAGLWLDSETVSQLHNSEELLYFKDFLKSSGFYVFTVNAFPYGHFHGKRIKEAVYSPDWTTQERMNYTCKVADILAELLPEGLYGSISTLPGTYRSWSKGEETEKIIAENIIKTAEHLKKLEDRAGKQIVLAFEMEPDCLWENPDQFIDFHKKYLSKNTILSPYIGVCYDTCHQELVSQNPGEGLRKFLNADIKVAKLQLSAAVTAPTLKSKNTLAEKFTDEVYLHQTRVFHQNKNIEACCDLPEALKDADREQLWKTHFHVPVYTNELSGDLKTAKDELKTVLEIIKKNPSLCEHLEIETYTYSVLPEEIKSKGIEASMAEEYNWIIERLKENKND